jgi:two-component system cell cycle sensor histidine kinase/response regulator CckA
MRAARATFGDVHVDIDSATVTASVARSGKPLLVPVVDATGSEQLFQREYVEPLTRLHLRSLLAVPLRSQGRTLGVLSLSRHGGTALPFDDDDAQFAGTLADHAALAISNARLLAERERELAEKRRADVATAQFVSLVEHSQDFIAMAGFDGRVLFVNEAGKRLVGLRPDTDVTLIPLRDFHTDEGMKRAEILRAEGRWTGDGHLRHFPTGELIPTQISSFVLRGGAGEPLGYATVQRDVREQRRLEDHLRQVQKMEAIGRLAGAVAHDFNNLLSVILSYSWILQTTLAEGTESRDDAEQIHKAGERAAALTQQLLAFSRQQMLELRVADLNGILEGVEKITRRLVGETIELRAEHATDLRAVRVDAGQIEQVVLNLAVNARDAMPNGGVVTIRTANVDLATARATVHGVIPQGRYVTMTVADTGVGMDEATLSRIFEPFFTTKPKGKGTGLGLATVFGVVKQSGGHIIVESRRHHGTTFEVYFPCSDRVDPSVAELAVSVPPGRGTETILIVEDDEQVRGLMRTVLERAGYKVLETTGPTEAIDESRDFQGKIDLLITDVVMPKMNGVELSLSIATRRPTTRVLYVSGYADDTVQMEQFVRDPLSLLRKPLTPRALLQRVRDVLAR